MDNNAKEHFALLDTFCLSQHVKEPTRLKATLWIWLFLKGLITSVLVKDFGHSDHSCVFFDSLGTPKVQISSVSVQRRYIKESTTAQFMEAIAMSPTKRDS